MNRPGERSEADLHQTESLEQENVTTQAYSFLEIEPNKKNKTIAKLLRQNRLKKLFDERGNSSLVQLKGHQKKMRDILRDKYRKPFPTCAELDKNRNVIALFRQTESVVSGGDSKAFLGPSFIVGPRGAFRISGLKDFDQGSSRGSVRVFKFDSSKFSFDPVPVVGVKSLIEEFEMDPFADENSGNLADAYEIIVEKVRNSDSTNNRQVSSV